MEKLLSKLFFEERGATSIEYAIMGSLIAAVIVGTVTTLGTTVANLFSLITNLFP
jgi:pilus assembly protein Flp/PilA